MVVSGSFYSRDSKEVARDILGKTLVRGKMAGEIVEVEAYYGEDDPASHAYSGKTQRNSLMFGQAGKIYVYLCYGMHYLLNITTLEQGSPGAVLIRALKPLKGLKFMKRNRKVKKDVDLANGPGKLTQAMDIDLSHNGIDVTDEESEIKVIDPGRRELEIGRSGRVGINDGGDRKLRFFVRDSKFLSRAE
jgi:DNA-3-methyladenine glycosylase